MRSTLEINSETAAKLQSLAKANNISVDDLLSRCVPGLTTLTPPSATSEEAIRALDAWISSIPDTVPLTDEAISRASIYNDR